MEERKDPSRGDGGRPRRRRKPSAMQRPDAPRSPRPQPATTASSGRPPKAYRIHWTHHGIEFLVIVAGIMVSFLLNEWRQERHDQRQERQLLIDLRDDLRQDSILMADEVKQLDTLLRQGQRLLAHRDMPIPEDSIAQLLVPFMSYIAVPFTQVTYHAMRATRSASLIEDRDLLRAILDLHETRYFGMREMFTIDRFQVLERMFPVTEKHVVLTEVDAAGLDRLLADPEWRNMAMHSLLFKNQIAQMLRMEITHGDTLMRRIETYLEQ